MRSCGPTAATLAAAAAAAALVALCALAGAAIGHHTDAPQKQPVHRRKRRYGVSASCPRPQSAAATGSLGVPLGVGEAVATEIARSHRVVFTFLVRDGEGYLRRNLQALARLARHFREARLFFVENDSTDGTRRILKEHMASGAAPLMRGLMLNVSLGRSTSLCPPALARMNCAARVRLLGYLRQRALDLALASWAGWDALVSVDMDFVRFDARDYLQIFARGVMWNASAVFGLSQFRTHVRRDLFPYDVSALLPETARKLAMRGCLVAVESAFSGFGTYFAAPLRAARPAYLPLPGTEAGSLLQGQQGRAAPAATEHATEHERFNRALFAWGAPRSRPLLVDPRFRPEYEWGEAEFLRRVDLERRRRRRAADSRDRGPGPAPCRFRI